MSKKHRTMKLTETTMRVLLLTLGSAFSTIIMVFSIMALYYVKLTPPDAVMASVYLFLIFVVLGLTRFITYLRDRTKTSLIRFITLFILNISLSECDFDTITPLYVVNSFWCPSSNMSSGVSVSNITSFWFSYTV